MSIERVTAALADRYAIEGELGAGGMATVYAARDLKHDRKVAVKVLRPELAAVIGAERFLREIRTTATLRHPNILPLYDSGDVNGVLYYVMPLVEGESLRDRLVRERQLPVQLAVQLAREVAEALALAHAHGVVHRDIKPENILLDAGHAVVADFGIALAVSRTDATRLTETGLSIGTPTYMSPEQAGGDPQLDGRSDLYSLGCVLYEMLCGQPPFTGPTVESVVHQHLAVEAPPVTNLRPAVPASLAVVLGRALAKSPADRFYPIAHFAEALEAVGSAAALSGVGTAATMTRAPVRRRTPWMIGVAATIVVVALGYFVLRPTHSPSSGLSARAVAVLPFDNFSPNPDDAYFANGITEEITSQLSRVGALRVVSRTAVTRALESDMSLAEIGSALAVGSILEGSVRKAGDDVRITAQLIDAASGEHLWAQDFDRKLSDVFAIQRDVAVAIVSALQGELTAREHAAIDAAPTANLAAYQLYLRDAQLFGSVPEQNRSGIELLRQAIALDSGFEKAWSRLAWRYQWETWHGNAGAPDSALTLARHALELDPESPDGFYSLAMAYVAREQVAEAKHALDRALELDPHHENALLDGGWFATTVGELADGLRLSSRAIPLSPNVPNTRFHVVWPLLAMGDDERARAWLDLARAEGMEMGRLDIARIWLAVLDGKKQDAVSRARAGLVQWAASAEFELFGSDVLLFYGDLEGVRVPLERAARDAPHALRPTHVSARTASTSLGYLLYELGERERAQALLDASLRASHAAVERGSGWASRKMEIAAIHAFREHTDSAIVWLERGYQAGYRTSRLLAQDPMFASVRTDPRFGALLVRMDEAAARQRARVEREGIAAALDSMIRARPSR